MLREVFTSGQQVQGARGAYTVIADRLDETGSEHRLDIEVSWAEPDRRVEVAAVLSMRHVPGLGWARWLLAAAATRPWRSEFEPPADRIGLSAFADAYSSGGLAVDARRVVIVNGGTQREEVAELLAQSITAPDRSSGLLLLNQAAVVADVHGWSGLLQVVTVNDGLRRAINARLSLGQQLPTGYRLFAAPCDQQPDVTVFASMTAAELLDVPRETLLQPLLQWRRHAVLPATWRDDSAVATWWRRADPFAPEPELPDVGPDVTEVDRVRRELAEVRRSLDIERSARIDLERQHAADVADLEQQRAKVAELAHAADLAAENDTLHALNTQYAAALNETETELDDALRRITQLLTHNPGPSTSPVTVEVEKVPRFGGFEQLLEAARTAFAALVITADPGPASALDAHEKAELWRGKAWAALSTLNAFAAARRDGPASTTLREFVRSGQPGALIGLHTLRLGESDTVTTNERLRSARVFAVPGAIDPSGWAYFGAHIALERFKPPAPRLHFLDDLSRSGLLCVGYLAVHLPTTRTN